MNILPIPPTGRLFGTYFSRSLRIPVDEPQRQNNRLSTFAYTNTGRSYIQNFHDLRTALDGQRGPNVLALSGTSYLPDSSRWHLDVKPQGVLQPEQESADAVRQSQFKFLPVYDADGHPIHVSGTPNKMQPIKQIITGLVGNFGDQELEQLQTLAHENPDHWLDRNRLLLIVNSYDQARWAADEIRSRWLEMREKVVHLVAGGENEEYDLVSGGSLGRADAETFAKTNGRILIAPMQSIGRGLNIPNSQNKAAFGAIYFLTRSMPHPFDTQAIAQELNRRSFDWYNDLEFEAWQADGVYQQGLLLRRKAHEYWRKVELRDFYSNLDYQERRDLAATTAGQIIQAVGRLVRGGIPFHGFFVDAAWGRGLRNGIQNRLITPKPVYWRQ